MLLHQAARPAPRSVLHAAFASPDAVKERAMKRLVVVGARLRLPTTRVDDALSLMERAAGPTWAASVNWADLLSGACIYIAARQGRLAVTIDQVADAVHGDVMKLARMFHHIVKLLAVTLPEVDLKPFVESAISLLPMAIAWDVRAVVARQAGLLLDCARAHCLLTGRRPLPVAAAALLYALQLNNMVIEPADVCSLLHASPDTTRLRYRELQYFEAAAGAVVVAAAAGSSGGVPTLAVADNKRIAKEVALDRGAETLQRSGVPSRPAAEDPEAGSSHLAAGPLPPAFQASRDVLSRRKSRLAAAKVRIQRTSHAWGQQQAAVPLMPRPVETNEALDNEVQAVADGLPSSSSVGSGRGSRKQARVGPVPESAALDSEDLKIEALLLKGGFYSNARLELEGVAGAEFSEAELDTYIRSPAEVAIMQRIANE
eukprot:SM000207S06166  [mRNA]  locus=s207:77096:80893:- [translate_table: standard]